MKLVTFTQAPHDLRRVGVLHGDMILPVSSVLGLDDEPSMLTMLEGGPSLLEMLSDQVAEWIERHSESASLPVDETVPVWQAALQPPLPNPPSIRDFYAFEQHVAAGYARRNRPIPSAWYQMPVFYFGHTSDLFGPDQPVPYPVGTSQLDFELEIACVIGSHGRDIAPERAFQHIAGFIILNDWSARDIQATEMSVGLGPAKGKDFATSIGPALVTLDDLEDRLVDDRLALDVSVSVNGVRLSSSNTREMHWSWADLIATASRNVVLRPGDIIASGTVPGGCLLELGEAVHPWLVPGDVVELDVERLGRLRSSVREVTS